MTNWRELVLKKYHKIKQLTREEARDLYISKCEHLHNYGYSLFTPLRPRTKKDGIVTLGHKVILGVSYESIRICSDYSPTGQ